MVKPLSKVICALQPSPPCCPSISVAPLPTQVFAGIREKLGLNELKRDEIQRHHRVLLRSQLQANHLLTYGEIDGANTLVNSTILEGIKGLPASIVAPPPQRDARISQILQKTIALLAQLHFFRHSSATLISKAEVCAVLPDIHIEDNEYLIGSIWFVEELSGYGLRRATMRDARSVALARDLCAKFLELLMEFNFRNDALRRSYDSVKWNVRRLNELLYELSTTSSADSVQYADIGSSSLYTTDCINVNEIQEIQARIETFDKTRELVLQAARGKAQKLAKHSIFSMQRGDYDKATTQLNEAISIAQDTFHEHIGEGPDAKNPALRSGAFGDCMEEIAEAKIFLSWLQTGSVADPASVPLLTEDEYLGGLIDFTGEVGRFAVAAATKRDTAEVERCFSVALAVTEQVALLPTDGRLGKKLDALKSNTKKIEQLLFDLSKRG